jgi:hypothetical protein
MFRLMGTFCIAALVFFSLAQATTSNKQNVPASANGTVMGMVVDSAFTATTIMGAIVTLLDEAGTTVVGTDTSGDDGSFEFDNVAMGNYKVRASAAGYASKSFTAIVLSDAPVMVFVALPKAVTSTVMGMVVDSAFTATTIAGAIVTLLDEAGTTVIGTDTSLDDGSFEFTDVPVGNYNVRASAAGYVSKSFSAIVLSDAPVMVFVALPQGENGVLPHGTKNNLPPGSLFAVSSKGMLNFGAGAESGVIAVFGFDGKQLFRRTVNRYTVSLALPEHLVRGKALVVRYNGKGFVYQRDALIP